ncbi:hypothetical protein V6N12_071301 [Hibiscus sabdariffa]|uniref:RNase H type-1 domain-containing protein n=1 Tax=Hibiscus sabdariffa TaxID=183260 RepID=A0ABR2FJD9_9ROSI
MLRALIWNLWLYWNERVFDPQLIRRETVLQRECTTLVLGSDVAASSSEPVPRGMIEWRKPPTGRCKLNMDSLNAIKAQHDRVEQVHTSLVPYIVEEMSWYREIKFEHVYRESNQLANLLTKTYSHEDFVCH